ncbi:NUDIX hydrolase [Saccharopolyspora elongata]|uniref:NUDIX domain-containing protein n=1 Tax=Saccharopolyspora elongata TaxID=2530387 RepID=A0A4V2YMQ7_9PSEU|nr:NUDIX hydrolase [Saccharopolyspora elongata]TDD51457.1 NUDIX domain-containing protein [Saccharopolyspora elongata]
MSGPHADALRVLGDWRPADPQQDALRHAFLTLLDARADACLRACEPGHVTASAVLLDAAGENVLLTLHPRVGMWLQLGGHCEPADTSLAGAALREATEESGVDGLVVDPEPAHLDVHPITCSLGKPTRHFDVRFIVRAPEGAEPARSDESLDLRWWPLNALPEGSDIGPLMAAARARG